MNRKVAACARAHVCIWPVKWLPKQQPKQEQKRCPLRKNNLTMKKQNIDFILNEGNTGQSHCQNTVSRKEESRRAPDLAEAKSLSSVWKKKKHYQEEYGEKLPSEPPEETLLKMQITEYYFYHPATQGCTKWNTWLCKNRLCTPLSLNKMHLRPQIMMKLKQRNVTLKWCHVIFTTAFFKQVVSPV